MYAAVGMGQCASPAIIDALREDADRVVQTRILAASRTITIAQATHHDLTHIT